MDAQHATGSNITLEQLTILMDSVPAGSLKWACSVALANDCQCSICRQVKAEALTTCAKAWNARSARLAHAALTLAR
jgi:hypothetical protein